jgi:8-oxo-dGTP pyrophosphatase MutT (NUDIX family)
MRPLGTAEVVAAVAARPLVEYPPPDSTFRTSAVLVLLADGPDGAEVLLTRRSEALPSHRGEVSFPGGRIDAGESIEAAALREAEEEVALDPRTVQLCGRLDPIATMVTRNHIVPVVGSVEQLPVLTPSEYEVDRIFWVSLVELAGHETFREELWPMADGHRPVFFFELSDETIWGATARVLHQLLRVALGI